MSLGHKLGKDVVARVWRTSRRSIDCACLGADYIQGYAVARPMPAEELGPWLRHTVRRRRTSRPHPSF